MPRFVVLEHDSSRGLHWDFMLEIGNTLATWSLPQPPDAGGDLRAESLPDHRPLYLDYEGPVSKNRGTVTRWDRGTYEVMRRTRSEWIVLLAGTRLFGTATLGQGSDMPDAWTFTFRPSDRERQ
ncbi:MAG: hypothetical protein GXY83_23160 [Rhodopirellula sp.]|nr:hypothetical protein [Rhodopirellula sp.]